MKHKNKTKKGKMEKNGEKYSERMLENKTTKKQKYLNEKCSHHIKSLSFNYV